jgi:hypothetical protein
MRFVALLLFTVAWTSCAPAQSSGWTGNEILAACRDVASSAKDDPFEEPFVAGHCAGMIQALMVTSRQYSDGTKFCSPENASTNQGAKVLVKFLDDHPQALNLHVIPLALAAFRNAWPCPKAN